jgi:excisionase family DNA binding protein
MQINTSVQKDSASASSIKWGTVSEAARYYRVSRNTIYEACRTGELNHARIRSTLRIPIDTSERYLTVSEVAAYLQVSPSTVYEACSLKNGPGFIENIRIRSRIRIPASSLIPKL